VLSDLVCLLNVIELFSRSYNKVQY